MTLTKVQKEVLIKAFNENGKVSHRWSNGWTTFYSLEKKGLAEETRGVLDSHRLTPAGIAMAEKLSKKEN